LYNVGWLHRNKIKEKKSENENGLTLLLNRGRAIYAVSVTLLFADTNVLYTKYILLSKWRWRMFSSGCNVAGVHTDLYGWPNTGFARYILALIAQDRYTKKTGANELMDICWPATNAWMITFKSTLNWILLHCHMMPFRLTVGALR